MKSKRKCRREMQELLFHGQEIPNGTTNGRDLPNATSREKNHDQEQKLVWATVCPIWDMGIASLVRLVRRPKPQLQNHRANSSNAHYPAALRMFYVGQVPLRGSVSSFSVLKVLGLQTADQGLVECWFPHFPASVCYIFGSRVSDSGS